MFRISHILDQTLYIEVATEFYTKYYNSIVWVIFKQTIKAIS